MQKHKKHPKVHRESQGTLKSQTNLEKNKVEESLTLPALKAYLKATAKKFKDINSKKTNETIPNLKTAAHKGQPTNGKKGICKSCVLSI